MAQYCCVIHISDILPKHERKLTFWAWPQLDIPKRYRKLTFLSMTDTYIHTLRGQIPHSKPRANALGSNSSKLRYMCDQCVLSDVAQTVSIMVCSYLPTQTSHDMFLSGKCPPDNYQDSNYSSSQCVLLTSTTSTLVLATMIARPSHSTLGLGWKLTKHFRNHGSISSVAHTCTDFVHLQMQTNHSPTSLLREIVIKFRLKNRNSIFLLHNFTRKSSDYVPGKAGLFSTNYRGLNLAINS